MAFADAVENWKSPDRCIGGPFYIASAGAPNTPPGQAKVVPCKRAFISLQDIVAHAAALWAAKQSEERE
jgi:hypothetical protein